MHSTFAWKQRSYLSCSLSYSKGLEQYVAHRKASTDVILDELIGSIFNSGQRKQCISTILRQVTQTAFLTNCVSLVVWSSPSAWPQCPTAIVLCCVTWPLLPSVSLKPGNSVYPAKACSHPSSPRKLPGTPCSSESWIQKKTKAKNKQELKVNSALK